MNNPEEDITPHSYFDDNGPSKTLNEALKGDRTASLRMWRFVAEGVWDDETQYWCQTVAQRLLNEDNAADWKRRPDAVLNAVGLAGKRNKFEVIDEICLQHMVFINLETREKRGEMVKAISNEVIKRNLVHEDSELEKLIYRRIEHLRRDIISNSLTGKPLV